jgi:ParB-like chromosome segregation protein Spo0J
MSREQRNRLKTSIQKFGFIVPIITNKDLLIADGERLIIAKELAMPNVLGDTSTN